MKQFLKYVLATVTGIILVLVIVGILGGISLVGLAAKSASTTQVEENSVYTLKLSGLLTLTSTQPAGTLNRQGKVKPSPKAERSVRGLSAL